MIAQRSIGGGLALGLLGVIALHVFEPTLAITWSFAHLARDPWRVGLAIGLTLALPLLGAIAWPMPAGTRPLSRLRAPAAAVTAVVFVAAIATIGGMAPAPALTVDPLILLGSLVGTYEPPIRWMLGAWTLDVLTAPFRPGAPMQPLVGATNGALAAIGMLGLAVAVRKIALDRREAFAITALTWSAFGTLQISIGYLEIYPLALALLGIYVALAAGALRGDASLVGCAVVAALAPFFYIGLALLAPSTLVLAVVVARREGGVKRVAIAAGAGIVAAGAATLPVYGIPFAWHAFAADAAAASQPQVGLQPGSSLLPASYLFSAAHASEVLHSLLLLDGVGWLMLLGPGLAVCCSRRLRQPDPFALFLVSIALPYLAYVVAMDPIYGAYQDWDLWATGTPVISLLGAWAFVHWGRPSPRLTGALLGLALACAAVHALARLHAMDLDNARHQRESPVHAIEVMTPGGPPPLELPR